MKNSKQMYKKVNEIISREDVTLLFVTHATGVAKEFCNRGLLMKEGKLIFDGDITDAIEKYETTFKKK